MLWCKGRLHNASLPYDTKHPIILPKAHWCTQLIIKDAHEKTLRGGVAQVLANLRKIFWIPKVRQAIKSMYGV